LPWKPITEQFVVANLGGKVRQLLVAAWNSDSGAVKVEWPPPSPTFSSRHRYRAVPVTRLEIASYEPLDPDGFLTATTG
jgi:hypothetical protein